MNLTLLQTSDEKIYKPLLDETARINKVYCEIHNIQYMDFIGIKRGYHPWQATFNRISLLAELSKDTTLDWVIFLDADAYISDLKFALNDYLRERMSRSLIIAPGTDLGKWDVNAGVFFLNLKHLSGQRLVKLWSEKFLTDVSDENLRKAYYP